MKPTVATAAPGALAERPHALYRFFDESGALLYVGITHHPTGRWRQHRGDKPWWHEVRSITLEPYEDRITVLAAEKAAIEAEQPKWNFETRSASAAWPSMYWDSEEVGTLATLNELAKGAQLMIAHAPAASVEALLDLRHALTPCVNPLEGRPMTLVLPIKCEDGIDSRRLFAGTDLRYPTASFCFKTKLSYRAGRRMRRVLDEHFRAFATENNLTLWEPGS